MNLFTPTSNELTAQLLPAVRRGCDLAQRGALYAAQTEFIQVIRRIAQVHDSERGTDQHSRALAEGLRAIEEAADFVPTGAGLEGDLDVAIAASSHRTPLVRQSPASVAPHTAVALYHGFAQERMAKAVAGQQAGSMALFGLGKVNARRAERNDDDVLATRSAMTMYLAALAACPVNHLAANELGVLLCRNGHAAEAVRLFEQTIDQSPSATAYHNLAVAQRKLGLVGQAAANQRESDRLAAWERATGAVSRRAGVDWVPADQFALAAPSPTLGTPVADYSRPPLTATGQNAPAPIPYTAAPAAQKSPLQKAAALARSISLPGTGGNEKSLHGAPAPRAALPGPVAARRNMPWF
jgi:tetratricopeptide (TPR) repeat protein